METIFGIEFQLADVIAATSLVIAVASFIVAILSAYYTYSTLCTSKKANEISLLERRSEIYTAFRELKIHMQQKSRFADMSEVAKFYYSSENAKIYFPSDLATEIEIEIYFNACFQLADIHFKYKGINNHSSIESQQHIDIQKNLATKLDAKIVDILKRAQI